MIDIVIKKGFLVLNNKIIMFYSMLVLLGVSLYSPSPKYVKSEHDLYKILKIWPRHRESSAITKALATGALSEDGHCKNINVYLAAKCLYDDQFRAGYDSLKIGQFLDFNTLRLSDVFLKSYFDFYGRKDCPLVMKKDVKAKIKEFMKDPIRKEFFEHFKKRVCRWINEWVVYNRDVLLAPGVPTVQTNTYKEEVDNKDEDTQKGRKCSCEQGYIEWGCESCFNPDDFDIGQPKKDHGPTDTYTPSSSCAMSHEGSFSYTEE